MSGSPTLRDHLRARPWRAEPDPLPPDLAGMLGPDEGRLFHHLARAVFGGHGAIVDAGSFLGKSAFAFATGLRANPCFDPRRDRVHCFDNFVVNEENTVDFVQRTLGLRLAVGDSTRGIFERQVAPVRELLEVHEGDFHLASWPPRPIELLMIDVAKSESLGRRVVEIFFRRLIPGRSLVIHQDYHHPWQPHLHVTMESLADCFELVVPRVDDSAVFLATKPIPDAALQRASAYDFTHAEQLALMDGAVGRLPAEDRSVVELARLKLRSSSVAIRDLRAELAAIERRPCAERDRATWPEYVGAMRDFLDEAEGWQRREAGDFARALELAEGLLARGRRRAEILVLHALASIGLQRPADAEPVLRESLQSSHRNGYAYVLLARIHAEAGRLDAAEDELVRGLQDRVAFGTQPIDFLEALGTLWERRPRPERVAAVMARLRRELPAEPEVAVLSALVANHLGDRRAALDALRRARMLGLAAGRWARVLAQTGFTAAEVAGAPAE